MKGIVLIVDEDVNTRVIAETLLGTRGFEVQWAPDTAHALALLESDGADVTVLDLTLSTKKAWEVIRNLKDQAQATPIVIITDRAERDLVQFDTLMGADAFLRKPLAPAAFLAAIDSVIATSGARIAGTVRTISHTP